MMLFALVFPFAIVVAGCGGDTYCQSGPKYGTQCYSMTDARTPPGQRPPPAGEPPAWWGQPMRFGASQAKPAPPPPPPVWPPPSTYPTVQRDGGLN